MTPPITPAAPFRWFMKALDGGRRHPQAVFGGFGLLLLVAMAPSLLQAFAEYVMKLAPAALAAVYGLVMLFNLVVMPPLMGGALRLLHRAEGGHPVVASDVFDGFRDRDLALRMIGTALLCLLAFLLVFGLLFLLMPGKAFVIELFARSMATPPGGQPDMAGLPEASPWLLLWLPAAIFIACFATHGYMLAYAQAALGGRTALDATVTGFAALVRHSLPFLAFTVAALTVGSVLLLIVALVIGVVVGLLAMASPALAMLLVLPVYLGLLLMMYVVMFGFYDHAWRDIFGDGPAAPLDALEA